MKRMLCSVVCALIFVVPCAQAEAEREWQLKKDKAGIQVFSRPVDGSNINQIRGVTHVNGSVESIVALLQDMSFWPELNKIFSLARLQHQVSPQESLVYLQMDMPWPVRDRDVLNRRLIHVDCETGGATIEEVATRNEFPLDDDFVRIVESSQRWMLTPVDDGRVRVDWVTHTDPNGPIPSAIINFLSVSAPFDSLSTLRQKIESGAYREAAIQYGCAAPQDGVARVQE